VQQEFYTQFIHSLHKNNAGQLVGELWINCALLKNIPHREQSVRRYADKRWTQVSILSKLVDGPL